jgi:hypothetical protein
VVETGKDGVFVEERLERRKGKERRDKYKREEEKRCNFLLIYGRTCVPFDMLTTSVTFG